MSEVEQPQSPQGQQIGFGTMIHPITQEKILVLNVQDHDQNATIRVPLDINSGFNLATQIHAQSMYLYIEQMAKLVAQAENTGLVVPGR